MPKSSSEPIYTNWSSLIVVAVFSPLEPRELTGFILVKETEGRKRLQPFWKFPGGKGEGGESPRGTAVRELQGKTGLKLRPSTFIIIKRVVKRRGAYRYRVFTYLTGIYEDEIHHINWNALGNEGEIPRYFTVEDIEDLHGNNHFLPTHIEQMASITRALQQ